MKDELIENILFPTNTLSRVYCASLDWKLKELAKNEISIDDIKNFFPQIDDDVEELISKYKPFLREQKLNDILK
jgi:arsenate reductase-like glutaredoxin family protein